VTVSLSLSLFDCLYCTVLHHTIPYYTVPMSTSGKKRKREREREQQQDQDPHAEQLPRPHRLQKFTATDFDDSSSVATDAAVSDPNNNSCVATVADPDPDNDNLSVATLADPDNEDFSITTTDFDDCSVATDAAVSDPNDNSSVVAVVESNESSKEDGGGKLAVATEQQEGTYSMSFISLLLYSQ
jgi:hypothetical protein